MSQLQLSPMARTDASADADDVENRFRVNRVDSAVEGHLPRPQSQDTPHPHPQQNNGGNNRLLQQQQPHPLPPPHAGRHSIVNFNESGLPSKIVEDETSGHYLAVTDAGGPRLSVVSLGGGSTVMANRSFVHLTREALPRVDNFRNLLSLQSAQRPTLEELRGETFVKQKIQSEEDPSSGQGVKFGWIQGVLVRCLLNIWGVMLFLRLSWVVAEAGIYQACVIILLSATVTTLTTLSMSALSTNGEIRGGGIYFMISRALGPELGAAIGVIFALANALAVAMHTVGFCESLNDLLKTNGLKIVDGASNDIRITGISALIVLVGIVFIGMEWEAKAQLGLLVILLAAIVDYMIGVFYGPQNDSEISKGFLGLNGTIFTENLVADYRPLAGVEHDFFTVFSIFFPSTTGILAGANISGDLKNPSSDIPKGTLLAILVTTLSYIFFAATSGASVLRDATGNIDDVINGTLTSVCLPGEGCKWGLHNSFQVMELVSIWGPLIYAGCFAATLSSALACLVSAPKIFQALCKDKLFPVLNFFAKGYGKNNDPYHGLALTFIIAFGFILIANLNAIAPVISNFYMASYALVNFCTFHASISKPIGWRPTFKHYNTWLSLLGTVLCIAVMFLMSWWTALITFVAAISLFLIVLYQKPDVNWGSSTQAQSYKSALNAVQRLNYIDEHVKNYKPQVLVLCGNPTSRPSLLDFAYLITKGNSLLINGHIVNDPISSRLRTSMIQRAKFWLRTHKIKAFYSLVDNVSFENGAKSLIQVAGIGKLRPNILMVGFKNDWRKCNREETAEYFNVLQCAFDNNLAVTILRLKDGLDYSDVISEDDELVITFQVNSSKSKKSKFGTGPKGRFLDKLKSKSDGDVAGLDYDGVGVRGGADGKRGAAGGKGGIQNNNFKRIQSDESFKFSSSETMDGGAGGTDDNLKRIQSNLSEFSIDSMDSIPDSPDMKMNNVHNNSSNSSLAMRKQIKKQNRRVSVFNYRGVGGAELPKEVLNSLTQFQRKQKKGTIDVWWLYDDGGLTLLLPYILTQRPNWQSCKLRIFAISNKKNEIDAEHRNMASLLSKFRIDFSDLIIITDITTKPNDNTKQFFYELINEFRTKETKQEGDVVITEAEMSALKHKTNRHLRLRELLQEHSKNSSLVVMTLPLPRKGVVSAPLYLAWLDALTRDMPPFLLVRGNQTSVLTFYS